MSNQTQPQPPEGCVYGPWWDEDIGIWACVSQNHEVLYWGNAGWFNPDKTHAELLRVAAERDELRAEVERLRKFEPKAKVIDCSKGQHDWKRVAGTDSISECQVCGRQSGK